MSYVSSSRLQVDDSTRSADFASWITERLKNYSGPVIIDCGVSYSSGQIIDEATRLAALLVQYKDRVVLLSAGSGARFLVLLLALIKVGAIIAPISPASNNDEIAKTARTLGARVAVKLDSTFTLGVVEFDTAPVTLPSGMQCGPGFIRFTSGTSREARGVCIDSAVARVRATSAKVGLGLASSDVALWMLPMEYHFVAALFGIIDAGVKIVVPRSTAITDLMGCDETTFIYAAPPDIRFMIGLKGELKFKHLRLAVCTAGLLNEKEAYEFEKAYSVPISRVFGAIEIGLGLGNISAPGRERSTIHNSLGWPFPGYEVRISGDGSSGSLAFKGDGICNGYVTPFQQREVLSEDGWFVTSDMVEKLPDGSYALLGRVDSAINVGGYKVFPEEVEAVIMESPAVAEVLVKGSHHDILGSVVSADIVLRPGAVMSDSEVRKHCRSKLSAFKIPQEVRFVSELKKTKTGKICRWI